MTVAQRIIFYLMANGISMNDLSEMSGISSKRLHSILSGDKPIRYGDFIRIINALKVDPNTFMQARSPGEKASKDSDPIRNKLMVNIMALSETNLQRLLTFSNELLRNRSRKEQKHYSESIEMEVAL